MNHDDPTENLRIHYRTWANRGKFIADFAGLERSIDFAIMQAIHLPANADLLSLVLSGFSASAKIDIFADAIRARGLAERFRVCIADLRELNSERNRIAHAAVLKDAEDPSALLGRGDHDVLPGHGRERADITTNYRKAGPEYRLLDTDAQITAVRARTKELQLEVMLAGVLAEEALDS